MKIITINLNPVYDIFYKVPDFRPYKENTAESVSVFTGGKAMNVSRCLHVNGYESTAYILLGKGNCENYIRKINSDGLNSRLFYTEGMIRENITLITDGKNETRISVINFFAKNNTLRQILSSISKEADNNTIIDFSGKFPNGISTEQKMDFINELKKISSHIVLDSNSLTANDIIKLKPWFIKPNEEELESLTGKELNNKDDILKYASQLYRNGINNILISLGSEGAVYCGELGMCYASVPKIKPLSTIGAGDSTVAGFISSYCENLGLEYCIKRACAFGIASCLEPGTNPPLPEKVSEIFKMIDIEIINNN